MKKIYLTTLLAIIAMVSFARYVTPGTGVNWTLDSLVANAGPKFTFADFYAANDTIFINQFDTLSITSNATVKFAAATYMDVNGILIINPPTGVTFTAQNTATGYLGMRLDSTNNSVLRKLTFEYAVSLRIADCSPLIDSCIFRNNNNSVSTAFGSSAILLTRSKVLITNCQFLNNGRAAISGGSNVANAPKIINNVFMGNNTQNANVPQINMGTTGSDTIIILNNQILRASTNSGGVGFLPIGNVFALISGNVVKNNRYGLTFNGGSNITAMVSYNQVDSNNTQGDPNLGGSGIAFSGGSSTSHQNVIVKGNLFRWNLWGITIAPNSGGGAKPNLGNITNTDTTDDGRNQFIGNNNANTPITDLYNNTVDSIYAQNNFWGSDNIDTAEAHIVHKVDISTLGIVIFSPLFNPALPITLVSFGAVAENTNVLLNWKTASENNSHYFDLERSADGRFFSSIAKLNATGNSLLERSYRFTDINALQRGTVVYYRLKFVDKDGSFAYSKVVAVKLNDVKNNIVKVYPTVIGNIGAVKAEVFSSASQKLTVQCVDALGKLVAQNQYTLNAGTNIFAVPVISGLQNGPIFMQFIGEHFRETVPMIKQ